MPPKRVPTRAVRLWFEAANIVSLCASGSRNRLNGASVFVPPLKSPTRLDISSPDPPIGLNMPPPTALDNPPEAVFFNKLVHSVAPCEVVVLLLEADPNLMVFAVLVVPNESDRMSRDVPGTQGLEVGVDAARLEGLVSESARKLLTPRSIPPGRRPNNFVKSLFVFTLVLRNPFLFEKLDRFHALCFQGHHAAFT
jgi:hypothetical protein